MQEIVLFLKACVKKVELCGKMLNKEFMESFEAQIARHDSLESILELLVCGGVAKGIDGAVEIAKEVRDHIQMDINAGGAK